MSVAGYSQNLLQKKSFIGYKMRQFSFFNWSNRWDYWNEIPKYFYIERQADKGIYFYVFRRVHPKNIKKRHWTFKLFMLFSLLDIFYHFQHHIHATEDYIQTCSSSTSSLSSTPLLWKDGRTNVVRSTENPLNINFSKLN